MGERQDGSKGGRKKIKEIDDGNMRNKDRWERRGRCDEGKGGRQTEGKKRNISE